MSDSGTGRDGLEGRYRRLLAFWYPWEHRRRYEDEMLAVLMAGARPGQRRPSVRDAANLAGHGLMARFGAAGSRLASPAWVDAAVIVALLGALLLLSQRLARILEHLMLPGPALPLALWPRALGWAAVVVAALAGWRLLAAAAAWLTVAADTVLLVRYYQDAPVAAVRTLLPLALGILVALALTLPAPRRRALAVAGWKRLAAFGLALAAVHGVLLYNDYSMRWSYADGGSGISYIWFGLQDSSAAVLNLMVGIVAAAGIAALVVVSTLPRPVRWRMLALAAPIATLVAIVEFGLDGWAYSNGAMGHPIYLAAVQWVVLAAAPALALAVAAAVVHRLEHVRHMVALGEATDRARPASD